MAEKHHLLNEVDRCVEKIAYLRVLAYAAAELADQLGQEIYTICRQQNRSDLCAVMTDITTAVFWLRDEIFSFDPSREDVSPQNIPI